MTRTYLFLHKFWFFSTIYYFGNWAFIAVSPRARFSSCSILWVINVSTVRLVWAQLRPCRLQPSISPVTRHFVCRRSSWVWRFPAAEARSLWLKERWKLTIPTSAMMNTCTERWRWRRSLGRLRRSFQTYVVFKIQIFFLLSGYCGGVFLILALFRPHARCYWCVWHSARYLGSSPIPGSTQTFLLDFCELLRNCKLKHVT